MGSVMPEESPPHSHTCPPDSTIPGCDAKSMSAVVLLQQGCSLAPGNLVSDRCLPVAELIRGGGPLDVAASLLQHQGLAVAGRSSKELG